MNRSAPIARRTPMRRRRAAPRRSERVADRDFLSWVHVLPCSARALSRCDGPIEADHAGRRPRGRKADDDTCISLCRQHHAERHAFAGPFRAFNAVTMRAWLDEQIALTRGAYLLAQAGAK